jgi:H+/Na+-translocating ferredoxin:NAD+ oxidoreductase subunit G
MKETSNVLLKFIKQSWLVLVAAVVFGALVAGIHGLLIDRINANVSEKFNRQLRFLLADATTFEHVPADEPTQLPYDIGFDDSHTIVGYVIAVDGGGFADTIRLAVGYNADLTALKGIAVLSSNETPGFGDKIKDDNTDSKLSFKGQFAGCPVLTPLTVVKSGDPAIADENIVAISGATISSDAVVSIVNTATTHMKQLKLNLSKP